MLRQKKLPVFCIMFIICLSSIWILAAMSGHHLNALGADDITTNSDNPSYNTIKKITVTPSIINITKGKKKAITAAITYNNNASSKKEQVEWISKNPEIATVSQKGIVKAKKEGTTYVICTGKSGAIKARCKIVVRQPYNNVTSIALDKTNMCMNKKDKRTINLFVKYSKKGSITNEPIAWISSNNKVATVNKNGVVKGKANGTAIITAKSQFSNKMATCKVTVKKTKYIAFTFDDGPGEYTDKLLDALDKYNSKATFFVLGNRVNSYKKQLKREYNMGMEIGSHTYSHQNLKKLSKKEAIKEIKKASDNIKKVIGVEPTLLRPPYGNYNKTVKKNAGVPMIYWTVDTLDWKLKNAKKISKTILKNSGSNDIVLLHDIHSFSVNGFIKALPKLKKKGYELVTVSELYQINGKRLKKGVMYFGPDSNR